MTSALVSEPRSPLLAFHIVCGQFLPPLPSVRGGCSRTTFSSAKLNKPRGERKPDFMYVFSLQLTHITPFSCCTGTFNMCVSVCVGTCVLARMEIKSKTLATYTSSLPEYKTLQLKEKL